MKHEFEYIDDAYGIAGEKNVLIRQVLASALCERLKYPVLLWHRRWWFAALAFLLGVLAGWLTA